MATPNAEDTQIANVASHSAANRALPTSAPTSTAPYIGQFSVQPPFTPRPPQVPSQPPSQAARDPNNVRNMLPYASPGAGSSQTPPTNYYAPHVQPQGPSQPRNYGYYNYPQNAWGNSWHMGAYQYGATGGYPYPYPPPSLGTNPAPQYPPTAPAPPKVKSPTPSPSPSPSPPPEYHKDWDAVIKSFLSAVGLTQAVRGFEADMIVMNPEWERKKVPAAIGELMKDLLRLGQTKEDEGSGEPPKERSLDERKLDYVHVANGAEPRSQTSITKSISHFLAQNRARNDASNRNEFLQSLAEKRRRLNENGDAELSGPIPSCARTDAKTQNRDLQMKYDIAKNEDGPLRRTLKSASTKPDPGVPKGKLKTTSALDSEADYLTADRHPALDGRLQDVETHLAVRYGVSIFSCMLSIFSVLTSLCAGSPLHSPIVAGPSQVLEDHIIRLEKEYPPWAALHFNQPNRGWPPPPRPTPIIVPSHLTSTASQETDQSSSLQTAQFSSSYQTSATMAAAGSADANAAKGKTKPGRNTKSSLHRAVMERLEVQKAMSDLAGTGEAS
ncbi:hypothetical protein A0H81_09236 [Grifola frondosa]|uniref:Uncharacterized protein n=1 Tax=Grifola frondosa TaxID=5627 RepID=A0A1C7M0Q5_GRIFR|nr:hypothetical protein A0H81_09236 [Grifola frondosa]